MVGHKQLDNLTFSISHKEQQGLYQQMKLKIPKILLIFETLFEC